MAPNWLNLRWETKTVHEYEAEFSHLLRIAGEGYRDNERMKVQKFQNGLNPEIRHDVKLFELNTLSAVVSKARIMEKNQSDCKRPQVQRPQFLGKRPSYSSPSVRSYGQSSGPQSKKQKFFRKPVSVVTVDDAPSEKSEL